jgi:type II secretory pathway component GspD/PulD (secretin)
MRKIRILKSFITAMTLLFIPFAQIRALAEESKEIKEEIGKDIILREEYEAVADESVKKGNAAFQKNEFKEAIDYYLEAVSNLRKCSQSSETINKKIESCDKAISKAYMYWSEKVVAEAEKLSQAKMYDQAIKQCMDAIEIYPPCRKRMEEYIENYKTMKGIVSYRKQKSEETVMPDKEDMLYKVDVLLKKGVAYYKDGQLDKARDQFEEVLVINPYNMKAIDNLRKVNREIMDRGKERTHATRMERLAEVEWKMITPVVPRTITGAVESVVQPIEKKTVTDKIQEKLKNIIIDHIEFEEVTIPTVVKYLKQRSKQIDPEKVGVNIFLRLSKGNPEGEEGREEGLGGEEIEEDGDNDGDDWGDEDEDEGDDEGEYDGDEGDEGAFEPMDVPTVTMVVDDIPLGEAIRYICRAANLKYRIEKYAVVIASPNIPLEDVETKIYPLDNEAIDSIGDDSEAVKKHFESRGIVFPAGAKIVYDSRISRLIATNTPENLKKIEEIIHNEFASIDPQVLIQTKFVEIEQNDLDELGFEYSLTRSATAAGKTSWQPWEAENAGPGSTTWSTNDNTVRNVEDNGIGNIDAGARPDEALRFYHYNDKNVAFSAIVHALDQSDTADVLSTPRVTTMNGEEATIRMVTEKYYPESWGEATVATATTTGGQTTQVFVPSIPEFGDPTEEGIILRVTPNVDADRYTITLDMNPVIQERVGWTDYSYGVSITENNTTNNYTNTIRMAIIEARTVQTSVTIYDGETIILGGIIKDNVDTIDDQYPILGDVPIVGRMFQSKAKSSSKVNLLIFLTCRLVNPDGSPIRERELRGLPAFRN